MTIKTHQIRDANGNLRNTSMRILEVDFSNIEDVQHHFRILKSQIAVLSVNIPGFVSKNSRVKTVFDACVRIWSTDISSVYSNVVLDTEQKYYVYAHCNPGFNIAIKKEGKSTFAATLGMKCMPFYIGKGTGNRAFDLNRNGQHRKIKQKLAKFGKDIEVKIIKENLTELEALMYESKLIDIFGLTSFKGQLVNLDEGINSKERRLLYRSHLHEISNFYKNSV